MKTRSGARNDQTSRTVREVAEEAGVDPATARRRIKLAEQLEPFPETAEKVDSGEISR